MALSDKENEWLAGFFEEADQSDALSEWEGNFVADTRKRWADYGMDIRMSPRQWVVIFRMAHYKLQIALPDGVEPPESFR